MVPPSVDPRAQEELEDLREHDRVVLEFLSRDPSSLVGFAGLRRRLRIHPEQLSRALQRLARDDLISRTDLGYRISPKGASILSPGALEREPEGVPVLQAYLPGDVDLRFLVQALKGAWVGPLRWYGLSESPGELRLCWATEDDGIRLDARLRLGSLSIHAAVETAERLDEAARLGHQLFQHIARETSRGSYPGFSG